LQNVNFRASLFNKNDKSKLIQKEVKNMNVLEKPGREKNHQDKDILAIEKEIRTLFNETFTVLNHRDEHAAKMIKKMIAKRNSFFPGAQPVSMSLSNLTKIQKNTFLVCEKSDGVRYLLCQTKSGSYLLNRKNTYFQCNIDAIRIIPEACQRNLYFLLDGELIIDKKFNKTYYNFLVFDGLCVNGKNVMARDYIDRLKEIKPFIDSISQKAGISIRLFLKDLFSPKSIPFLFQNIIPKLSHENDGLIFTENKCPYYPGTCDSIIKWKPIHLNTIDFILVLGKSNRIINLSYELHCIDKTKNMVFFDYLFFPDSTEEEMARKKISAAKQNGIFFTIIILLGLQIVAECFYDWNFKSLEVRMYHLFKERFAGQSFAEIKKEERDNLLQEINRPEINSCEHQKEEEKKNNSCTMGGWRIERFRTDKEYPNNIHVANNVKASILDNITEEKLIKFITDPPQCLDDNEKQREERKEHLDTEENAEGPQSKFD
jgi:mRNA guanylyltransferase